MKIPVPAAVVTSSKECERARFEAKRLARAKAGTIDAAVRDALLQAVGKWLRQQSAATARHAKSDDIPTNARHR